MVNLFFSLYGCYTYFNFFNRLNTTNTTLEELMKTVLIFVVLLGVTSLFSMDKLTDAQSAELENSIRQIEFAVNNGLAELCITEHITKIEKILTTISIPVPEKKTLYWVDILKEEIEATKKVTQPAEKVAEKKDETCTIVGLNKADVLRALLEAAPGSCFWPGAKKEIPHNDELHRILEIESYNIDYLGGKPLKVNLKGNAFDTYLYNQYNGAGLAQRAIELLRKKASL
jgi:hypothetical protein